jgi:hypothetical protein
MHFPFRPVFPIVLTSVLLVALTNSLKFTSDPPFYNQLYAKIPGPRSILIDETGDILVSTQKTVGKLYLLYDAPDPNVNGSVQVFIDILFNGEGMNLEHGLAYLAGFLYASSASTVYRWPYTPGQRRALDNSSVEVVIANMPSTGTHISRTITFDKDDLLYVQVGSFGDVDLDQMSRSRIVRFNITNIPLVGIDYFTGEVRQ